MQFENTETFKNLARSFAGECQAGMRYQMVAKLAMQEKLKTLSDALDAHELIKVTVLDNAEDTPRDIAENIAELLEAVPVAVIGRKAIFYRYSRRDKYAHLEF